jgi:hypothetical protein
VAFWVSEQFTENNLCEVVRGIAGDLAEEVKLIDEFKNPKTVSQAGRCADGAVGHGQAAKAAGSGQQNDCM